MKLRGFASVILPHEDASPTRNPPYPAVPGLFYPPHAPARSKLFSAVLASLMQERGVNQVQLSQRSGVLVSRLNNYLQGKYRTIRPAHLEAISAGGTPAEDAALIQAYLLDLMPEDCRGFVEIHIPGAKETGRWKVPSKGLPKWFAVELRDLYVLCVSSVKVQK